jgi:transcriptional regulator with XRE-family HTH domain
LKLRFLAFLEVSKTVMATINDDQDTRGSRRPNPMDIHVGSRVRMRRMVLNMSQEKLGESLGLTFQQVQKYEKGMNRIGASRLYDLARVLGVTVSFFFQDAPTEALNGGHATGFAERPADDYVSGFLATREGVELNRAFQRISDVRVRRSVIELCRALAGEAADVTAATSTAS